MQVASRGSPLGLGTDLGGSIRMPCAVCGLAGMRPTLERCSMKGTLPNMGVFVGQNGGKYF